MKRYLLAKFLQKWSESGHKRKKQIMLVMGLFAFVGMGILVLSVWLSLKLGGVLLTEFKTLKPSNLITQIQDSEKPIYNIAMCLNQLNSLFTLDPWINAPITEIIHSTYQKCVQPIEIKQPTPADGSESSETDSLNNQHYTERKNYDSTHF